MKCAVVFLTFYVLRVVASERTWGALRRSFGEASVDDGDSLQMDDPGSLWDSSGSERFVSCHI